MARKITSCDELAAYRKELQARHDPTRSCVTVCGGTGCRAIESAAVLQAFRETIKVKSLEGSVDLQSTGCLGFWEKGPIVTLRPQGMFYVKVKPYDVPEIVEKTHLSGEEVERLFLKDPQTGQRPDQGRDSFLPPQTPIIFGAN